MTYTTNLRRINRFILKICFIFLIASSIDGGATEEGLEVIVLRNPLTDFSTAVSKAVQLNTTAQSNYLANYSTINYSKKSDLIVQIQAKINTLNPASHLLILGPSSTDEAIALDASITNASNLRILFVSPSVSSKQHYTNINLVGACLPDSERIDYVGKNAPKQWKNMSAVFVAEGGPWGSQIYATLCLQTNYFYVRSPALFINEKEPGQGSEYEKVAIQCVRDNVNLIFLALGDPSNVKRFLKTLKDQKDSLSAYRPCICLLGDYRFSEGDMNSATNDLTLITEDYINGTSLVMASEAEMGHEDKNLFVDLDSDLLNLLEQLNEKVEGNPTDFFVEITGAFGSPGKIVTLNQLNPTTSHYIRFRLQLDNALQSGVKLKWRESPILGKSSWEPLTPQLSAKWYYLDVARARVPWSADWKLVMLIFLAVCLGWIIEYRKRFIYLQKTFASKFYKSISWLLIVLATVGIIFLLCWNDFINPARFGWVIAACFSPMALLPMLQHLAFTKIPVLDKLLELPSTGLEKVLDRCINSQAKGRCDEELGEIEAELRQLDPDKTNAEGLLLGWWIHDLRRIKSKERAKRITMRFFPDIKLWDQSLSNEERVQQLKLALAYTRVILLDQTTGIT